MFSFKVKGQQQSMLIIRGLIISVPGEEGDT